MKKRTIVLLALLGLTAILEACNLISHGHEKNNSVPQTQQVQINQDSLPSAHVQNNSANQNYIGETKALETALIHAGVASTSLLYSQAKFDYDDGRASYEVEFYADNKEYDYTIDALTGDILGFDADMEYDFIPPKTEQPKQETTESKPQQAAQPAPQPKPQPTPQKAPQPEPESTPQQAAQPSNSGDIGVDAAKQIALGKVPGAGDSHIRIQQDYDDGRLKYEGKIIYNNMEYEFEIDAASGTLTDWDAESIYD